MTTPRPFPFLREHGRTSPPARSRHLHMCTVALMVAAPASALHLSAPHLAVAATADVVAEFPLLDGTIPDHLTPGPDGDVWFTQGTVGAGTLHEVGRITPTGTVTEFLSPTTVPRTTNPSGDYYYTGGDYDPMVGYAGTQVAFGRDGSLWYPGRAGQERAGLVQLASSATYTAYDTDASPDRLEGGLVATGDGRIWAVVQRAVTPGTGCPVDIGAVLGGGIDVFTPDALDTPAGVVPVPPVNGQHIGALTQYAVPCVVPGSPLVLGPDHGIWFLGNPGSPACTTCSLSTAIGRLDPSSPAGGPSAVWFPTPSGSEVMDLTAGPDGAVWFTERKALGSAQDQWGIGRLTVDGSFQEYIYRRTLSNVFVAPLLYITAGKDGGLWFTESVSTSGLGDLASDHIGRLTTCGHVDVYDPTPIHPSSVGVFGNKPGHVVSGPDGNIWFAEADPFIGRVSLHAAGPPSTCSAATSKAAPAAVTGRSSWPPREYRPIHRF